MKVVDEPIILLIYVESDLDPKSTTASIGFFTRDPIGPSDGWGLYVSYFAQNCSKLDPTGNETMAAPVVVCTVATAGGVTIGGCVAAVPIGGPIGVGVGVCIYKCPVVGTQTMCQPLMTRVCYYFCPVKHPPVKTGPARDKCVDACDKDYEEDGEQCRNLRDPAGRARCWAQLAEELARCIKKCPD